MSGGTSPFVRSRFAAESASERLETTGVGRRVRLPTAADDSKRANREAESFGMTRPEQDSSSNNRGKACRASGLATAADDTNRANRKTKVSRDQDSSRQQKSLSHPWSLPLPLRLRLLRLPRRSLLSSRRLLRLPRRDFSEDRDLRLLLRLLLK